MADQNTIQVNKQQVRNIAEQLKTLRNQLRDDLAGMQVHIDNSRYYWQGAAADEYRRLFQGKQENVEELLQDLDDFSTELLEMMGIYDQAETSSTEKIVALPSDFI